MTVFDLILAVGEKRPKTVLRMLRLYVYVDSIL